MHLIFIIKETDIFFCLDKDENESNFDIGLKNDPLTLVSVGQPEPPIGTSKVNPDEIVTYIPGPERKRKCRQIAGIKICTYFS